MGKPHPVLDYFTKGAGEKTTTDEKVEQVAEVRRKSSLPSTEECIPTSVKASVLSSQAIS